MSARNERATSERKHARLLKRAAYVESGLLEKERASAEQKRRERRCFWTWPWGHLYLNGACVNCDQEQDMLF